MATFLLSIILAASFGLVTISNQVDQAIQELFINNQNNVELAQASTSPTDQPSCQAAGKYWCSSGMAGGSSSFYCTDTPCTQSECIAKSYSWCADSQMSNGGWCQMSGTCPANDSATCTAQGSKWCADASMSRGGWCQSSGDCPIMSEAPCVAAGRTWCQSSTAGGTGWCAMAGSSCPTTTNTTTNSCPSGQTQCPAAGTSPAGCYTTCPTTTTTTTTCATGQQWCPPTGGTAAGYCATTCSTTTTTTCPTGQMQCPAVGSSPAGCYTTCPTTTTTDTTTTTTCPTGYVTCPASGTNPAGCYVSCGTINTQITSCPTGQYLCPNPAPATGNYCSNSACTTTTTTSCPSGQTQCPAAGTSPAGCYTTCPTTTTDTTTPCPTGQQLCPPTYSTDAGYCATTCATTTTTGPTPESCKTQNQYYCASSGTSTGWCSSLPCSETECKAAAKRWCPPMPMTNTMTGAQPQGWCTESNNTCPAYTAVDCAAQNGTWCKNQAGMTSGLDGWCQTSGGTCPAHDDASCKSQGGNWCAPSNNSGGGGWCATPPSTCPNEQKDKTDCSARGGQWCASQGGGWGWCANSGTKCPANTLEECTARSGKWCKSTATGLTSTTTATGWCSEGINATCPAYTAEDCSAQNGLWCVPDNGGMGWCNSGSFATCPSGSKPKLPTTQPVPITDQKQITTKSCPAMPTFTCRDNEEVFTVQNAEGCAISQCRPRLIQCPVILSAPSCTSGNEAVSYIDKDGCQKYECRFQRCPAPPANYTCATGWIPSTSAAGVCPVYECRNTEHSRTEECVRQIVGDDYFVKMKKEGVYPSKEMMDKITAACFVDMLPVTPKPQLPDDRITPIQCNLNQMKRDMTTGVKRELKRVDTKVSQLRRKGVSIPTNFQILITQLNTLVDAAGKATSCETLFEQGQSIPELMRYLQDQLLDIERLGQAKEFVKKFNRLLADSQREWKRVSGGLKGEVKNEFAISYTAALAEFKSAITAMSSAAISVDPDSIELASEQAYDRYQDLKEVIDHARVIRETAVILSKTKTEIRNAERLASRLAKAGEDVLDLTEAIAAAKEILAEATANKTKCARTLNDECLDLYERFTTTMTNLRDIYQEFVGVSDFNKLFGLGDLGGGLSQLRIINTLEQNKL